MYLGVIEAELCRQMGQGHVSIIPKPVTRSALQIWYENWT